MHELCQSSSSMPAQLSIFLFSIRSYMPMGIGSEMVPYWIWLCYIYIHANTNDINRNHGTDMTKNNFQNTTDEIPRLDSRGDWNVQITKIETRVITTVIFFSKGLRCGSIGGWHILWQSAMKLIFVTYSCFIPCDIILRPGAPHPALYHVYTTTSSNTDCLYTGTPNFPITCKSTKIVYLETVKSDEAWMFSEEKDIR